MMPVELAYIGPGAGFAFLGSFLTLLVGFVLGAVSLLVLSIVYVQYQTAPIVQGMFFGLKAPLQAGQSVPVILRFERAGEVQAKGLISSAERDLFARFAVLADMAIQVDDFPQDFGLAEGLARRGGKRAAKREKVAQ